MNDSFAVLDGVMQRSIANTLSVTLPRSSSMNYPSLLGTNSVIDIFSSSVTAIMAILENIREHFNSETARNKNSSLIAGFLFFAGWWVLIDAMAVDSKHQITTGHVFIGVFGTIAAFMVNVVKNSHISEENTSESGARLAKIWLLIGFVMGFASIIAAVWVMIDDFLNNSKKDAWAGVAILMQNVFILLGSLVFKFGRNEELWNE